MLMDLEMPILTGLEATRRLCGQPGAPVVVMLTVRASDEAVVACLRAGAAGFLLKSADPDAIADALRRAAAGEAVLSPEVTARMIETVRAGGVPGGSAGAEAGGGDAWRAALTEREQEVAEAVAAGLSNQQIADSLYMSLSTAKTNVSRILTKLGLDNRVQVALLVNGLLRPPAAETERK